MFKFLHQTCLRHSANTFHPAYYFSPRRLTQIERKVEDNRLLGFSSNSLKKYELILEKKFPRIMSAYNMFRKGTIGCILDVKTFLALRVKERFYGIDALTREELQLSYTIRRDFIRMLPILLTLPIPFATSFILPVAYYFPRQLLTYHYWSKEQQLEFIFIKHREKQKHREPLFQCMQAAVCNIENERLRSLWVHVMDSLKSGIDPRTMDIVLCNDLFRHAPYALRTLKKTHLKELLAIHGMSVWRPFKRQRLMERGQLIKRMDLAIQKEGGIAGMSEDSLQWAVSFRGVNPVKMSTEAMTAWLEQWLTVSEAVNENTISLLLHSPILLAYNHSSNQAVRSS